MDNIYSHGANIPNFFSQHECESDKQQDAEDDNHYQPYYLVTFTALLGNVIYCLINLSDLLFDAEATFKTLGIQMF